MRIKIIRSEVEYQQALNYLQTGLANEASLSPIESDELETLALLMEQFEKQHFPLQLPDPVQAILFRMEQANLTPRDLMPFLGSRSKVSEVLSGKRPLSISMIRALHSGLGIPAEVLIGAGSEEEVPPVASPTVDEGAQSIDWKGFPLREMMSRGYFDSLPGINALRKDNSNLEERARELIVAFMRPLGLQAPLAAPMLFKKTLTTRAARAMNPHALAAWGMRVLLLAGQNPPSVPYDPAILSFEFLGEVARLSWSERGPILAQEFLFQHGISLVIEPHLSRTHLDGAAIAFWSEHPVIGLTVRHDRIDNFWFCLLHELAHLKLHFHSADGGFEPNQFFDDIEAEAIDPREQEADEVAGEALVPDKAWRKSPVSVLPSPQAAERLARELRVHPAVVAGRVRHTRNSFRLLNNLVGQGEVRKHFPQVAWKGEGLEE